MIQFKNTIAIQQRTGNDIWKNLYEVVLFEGEKTWNNNKVLLQLEKTYGLMEKDYLKLPALDNKTQRLTHQLIHFSFSHIQLKKVLKIPGFIFVSETELNEYPFPKTLHSFLMKAVNGLLATNLQFIPQDWEY